MQENAGQPSGGDGSSKMVDALEKKRGATAARGRIRLDDEDS